MEKDTFMQHEDEVMAAFDKLRSNIKSFDEDVKREASSHTQVVAPSKVEGVIDRAEWDRILAEADAKASKEDFNAAQVGDAAVIGTRASRHASKAATKSVKKSAGSSEPKPKKTKKPKNKKKAGLFKKIILAILALCVVGAIAVGAIVVKIIKDAPEINPNNIYDLLSQSSVIYDINGEIVDNIYSGNALRTNVEYQELPKDLINAFVSIEDKTFFKHHGFNIIRIGGAIWDKISGKSERIGGTSTITQQLARNIFLESEKGARKLSRKIREAYYTIIIEKTLSKEQILEAYLNTVYLGFNSNGVSAASRAYFNKDIKDLNLIECAQLAALPQSPNNYAPLKRVAVGSVEDIESLDVVAANDDWITYYNDAAENRIKLVLRFMHEQEKIDDATYEVAKEDSIRKYLNPGVNIGSSANESSYFTDYISSRVVADLQKELGYSYQDAYNLLHQGGLIVNSTMDRSVQAILEESYADPNTFPKISLNSVATDKNKNIIKKSDTENADAETKVILYAYKNLFDDNGNFVMGPGEYKWLDTGSLVIYKGQHVNLYNVKSNGESDVRVDIKDFYEMVDGQLYSRTGSYWLIDAKYKTRDNSGNLIISADFFNDYPDAFTKVQDGKVEKLSLSSSYFVLASRIIQPQSAMVIIDNQTGQIRGMVGGRGIKGSLLFNRATATRQPGSSMKPLAIYSTALQLGYDAIKDPEDGSLLSTSILAQRAEEQKNTQTTTKEEGEDDNSHLSSKVFTAATVLDSMPFNQKYGLWPSNFDGTYGGRTTLRRAVEKSLNACAVNLYLQMDPKVCMENVQNFGITSLVTEGDETDENASSLALGGMIKGISPLEMASAYSTFGNYGVHNEHTCYTTVTDRKGNVILKADAHPVQVLDEEVASLMLNILETTVTHGIASGAKLNSQPSAGKTGTTSEMYDIWFCGLTPKYAAATWVGCDSNINLGSDSSKATKVWKAVMEKVGKLDTKGEFELKGDFVTVAVDKQTGQLPLVSEYGETPEEDIIEEIFIKGTEPTFETTDENARGYVEICADSGYLATPYCYHTTYKEYINRPDGKSWEGHLAEYILLENGKIGEDGIPTGGAIDKTQYLNLVEDCSTDYPDYYCPYHNYDPETYPISPLVSEGYSPSYNPYENEEYEEGSEETGEYVEDQDAA